MRRAVLALLCVAVLAAGAPRASAQTMRNLSIGLTGKTATDWPVFVAEDLGFWKRYGIATDFVVTGSVAATAQQLTAGALGIGEVSSTQHIEAVQGGAPLSYFLDRMTSPPYTVVAKKEFHRLADLKGQTVIIGGVNDITRIFFEIMMRPTHVSPEQYTYTYAGSTTQRYAALASGSVAAAILFPPLDFKAQSQGFTILGNLQSYVKSFPFIGFAVSERFAKEHPDQVVDFTKGYLRGVRWLLDPANKVRAIDILAKHANVTQDDSAKTYDELITQFKVFSPNGVTPEKSFVQVTEALGKLGVLKAPLPPPSKFYDNRFVTQANAQLGREH